MLSIVLIVRLVQNDVTRFCVLNRSTSFGVVALMCTVYIWNQNKTSGIMVVARNQEAASYLCRAWRERELVQKTYLAHVKHWPPFHQHSVREGTIDIALAPSRTERIKWEAIPVAEGGKECKTYWKLHQDFDKEGIILELHPITGRTHQLRLHCAEIGSGIVGDSLYGDSPIAWFAYDKQGTIGKSSVGNESPKTLRLHAHKLTIPKPKTGEKITFESPVDFFHGCVAP